MEVIQSWIISPPVKSLNNYKSTHFYRLNNYKSTHFYSVYVRWAGNISNEEGQESTQEGGTVQGSIPYYISPDTSFMSALQTHVITMIS